MQGTCVAPSVAGNNCSKTGQDYLNEFERTGAEQAFEHIVRLYAGMVYSVCLQVTKNNHDAEDSTQAVFLALAQQVKLGKQVKYLGPWLRQVAKRTALDLRKSRKRREKREENHSRMHGEQRLVVTQHAGEYNLDAEVYKQALHEELSSLPARYREPLMMHYFGGLRAEQTAVELNCKPKTLAVRLHRGRKMLAAKLSRRGIFVADEMLGMSIAPLMFGVLSSNIIHDTTRAAAGLMSGQEISAAISAQVMGLVRVSAKATLFAKIKLATLALVLSAAVLGGSAQAMKSLGNAGLKLPSIKLDVGEWLRPLFRSLIGSPKLTANTTANEAVSINSNRALAIVIPAAARSRSTALLPASTGDSGMAAFASRNTSYSRRLVEFPPDVQHDQEAPAAISFAADTVEWAEPIGHANLAATDARSIQFVSGSAMPLEAVWISNGMNRRAIDAWVVVQGASTGRLSGRPPLGFTVPAPEPANMLLLGAAGSGLLIRRRSARK